MGYSDAGILTAQGPGWKMSGPRFPQHGSRLGLGQQAMVSRALCIDKTSCGEAAACACMPGCSFWN